MLAKEVKYLGSLAGWIHETFGPRKKVQSTLHDMSVESEDTSGSVSVPAKETVELEPGVEEMAALTERLP